MDYEMGQDRVYLIKGTECCSPHLWEQNKNNVLGKVQFLHGGPPGRRACRASCLGASGRLPSSGPHAAHTFPKNWGGGRGRGGGGGSNGNGILVKDQWGRARNVSKNREEWRLVR